MPMDGAPDPRVDEARRAAGAEAGAPWPSGASVVRAQSMPAPPRGAPADPPLRELLRPEPWRRSLWTAAKNAAGGSLLWYSLMSLMGEPPRVGGALFMGAWFAIGDLAMRRKGTTVPGLPALLGGAATLLAGAGILVVAAVKGGPPPYGLAAMAGFLGTLLGAMGWRSMRRSRETEAGLATDRVAPVLIPQAELARRVQRFQEEQRVEGKKVLRRLFGGLLAFMGFTMVWQLPALAPYEPPEWVWIAVFFGGWGAFGLFARRLSVRGLADAQRHGLVCPSCDRPFFSAFANLRLASILDRTGRCPNCAVRLIHEEGA